MKNSFSTFLCVLLTIALVVGAVCIGAVRGWSGEREAALGTLSQNEAMAESLQSRAMDAANLAVVAARHLTDDADVAALRDAYAVITGGDDFVLDLLNADEAISVAAASLAEKLPGLTSVKASARDQVYISTLTRTLSENSGITEACAAAIWDYDTRLTSSLTGKLAMLLGVEPLVSIGRE